jgi:branched-chain amino acid transport system substrate-binding protein
MNKKIVVTLFAAFFALSIFAVIPTISSWEKKAIKIGVILAGPGGLETMVPLFEEIIEPDINAYCAKLPRHRFTPKTKFEFLIDHADWSDEVHLEKVQMFHEMGVDLIIGGFWSSMAAGSLDYMNANDMLLLSPSSTAIALAIPDDNLFRLRPDDTIQGRIIAKMMQTKGVENAIVFYRDDTWGNGLYETFEVEYEALGGNILGVFPYEAMHPDDYPEDYFNPYLQQADDLAAGQANVGVLYISFAESRIIVRNSINYPNIYNPPWFSTEGGGRSEAMLDENPDQAVHLKCYSALSTAPSSPKFNEMDERLQQLIGEEMGFGWACDIDAAWIIAQAVLETRPTSTSRRYSDAMAVMNVLSDVAWRHYGYSGYCLLNEAGDRAAGMLDIWGYYLDDGTPSFKKYGSYDSATDELVWF